MTRATTLPLTEALREASERADNTHEPEHFDRLCDLVARLIREADIEAQRIAEEAKCPRCDGSGGVSLEGPLGWFPCDCAAGKRRYPCP